MMNTTCIVFLVNQLSIRFAIDENGNKVFDASYDAWGKQTVRLNTIGLQRGYTGHEMINEFNLINMNGRIYDLELGRFFSPDKFVQESDNIQNYNRYSYCLNNPLKFVDHSGNIFGIDDIIFGFALGAIMGYANACFKHDNVFWGTILGGVVGALGSWGGAAFTSFFEAGTFGAGIISGAIGGSLMGAVSSFATVGLTNVINHRNFFDGMGKGLVSAAIMGGIVGAIVGGARVCEKNHANGCTAGGRHLDSRETIDEAFPGVEELQADKTKHCYAYAIQKASGQIGKQETAQSIIDFAGGLDGADVNKILSGQYNKYTGALKCNRLTKLPRGLKLEGFSVGFKAGKTTAVITIDGHVVTLKGYDTIRVNNWFGGGSHLVMDKVRIFDPLCGVRYL